MTAKTYLMIPYNEKGENVQFDKYQNGELPINREGCIYIFSYHEERGLPEHHHIDSTSSLKELFDENNIIERLNYWESNCLLINECEDEDKRESITKQIRDKYKIPYNFKTGI